MPHRKWLCCSVSFFCFFCFSFWGVWIYDWHEFLCLNLLFSGAMGMNMDWAFWDGNTISYGRQIWVFLWFWSGVWSFVSFLSRLMSSIPLFSVVPAKSFGWEFLPWCALFRYHGRKEGLWHALHLKEYGRTSVY